MRGGTSKGPIFMAADLPPDERLRNQVLLRVMGSPDKHQIDGLGGGQTVTSKAAIVSRSTTALADIDVRFAQIDVERQLVDTGPMCGNMLAAVGPFAIDEGLVSADESTTTVAIRDLNTGSLVDAVVQTPGGHITYEGDCEIPGLTARSAPVELRFRNIVGSKTGALFPTGRRREVVSGVEVTCIDVAMPMVIVKACDLGKTGYELPTEIDADRSAMTKVEQVRREAGRRMGLGDVAGSVIPKVGLVSPPRTDGHISSRYLTPLTCHPSYAVTGSICVTTAALIPGTMAGEVAVGVQDRSPVVRLEHPGGTLPVMIDAEGSAEELDVRAGTVQRTARRLMAGETYVPRTLWP